MLRATSLLCKLTGGASYAIWRAAAAALKIFLAFKLQSSSAVMADGERRGSLGQHAQPRKRNRIIAVMARGAELGLQLSCLEHMAGIGAVVDEVLE